MIPIYFPSVYLSEHSLAELSVFFPRLAAYSVLPSPAAPHMKRDVENGRLELRVPVRGDDTELMGMIRGYKEWAQLHQGKNLSYFKSHPEKAPFVDENATSYILSTIRRKNGSDTDRELSEDRKALLFLQFSHEFDASQAELQVDLSTIDSKRKQLFQAIGGDHDEPEVLPIDTVAWTQEDTGAYMTAQRMNAWNHLLQHDTAPQGLFVTTSRAAFEFVLDRADQAEMLETVAAPHLHAVGRDEWNRRFDAFLRELSQGAEGRPFDPPETTSLDGENADAPVCTVYRISGQSPKPFFNRFSTFSRPIDALPVAGAPPSHTLLALVGKRS